MVGRGVGGRNEWGESSVFMNSKTGERLHIVKKGIRFDGLNLICLWPNTKLQRSNGSCFILCHCFMPNQLIKFKNNRIEMIFVIVEFLII